MTKNNLIPELRFPEFKNNKEWEELSLKDILIKNSLKNKSQKYKVVQSVSKIHGFINQDEFFENRRVASLDTSKYYIIKKGYFAYNPSRIDVGSLAYKFDDETSIISPLYVSFKADNEKIHDRFLLSWFFSDNFTKQMIFEGGVRNTLNYESLIKIKINLPSPLEQQKIASCLSSLDELIEAHNQKLENLNDHKKGLMQNLFPQEGETVPKYRFPEFENDGRWKKTKLGELIEIKGRIGYRGYTLEDIVSKGEGAISMSPSNINEFGTLSFTKSTYITWEKYEESPEIKLQNGFTVLVKTGSTYGKVAYIKNLTEKTTINPQLVVLKPQKVNSYFLYLLVANDSIQKQINATVVGGAIPTLSQESISNFEILVPNTKEQIKIADCLSYLNDLIISQTERIEHLNLHKKGLMQGLFPKINN